MAYVPCKFEVTGEDYQGIPVRVKFKKRLKAYQYAAYLKKNLVEELDNNGFVVARFKIEMAHDELIVIQVKGIKYET